MMHHNCAWWFCLFALIFEVVNSFTFDVVNSATFDVVNSATFDIDAKYLNYRFLIKKHNSKDDIVLFCSELRLSKPDVTLVFIESDNLYCLNPSENARKGVYLVEDSDPLKLDCTHVQLQSKYHTKVVNDVLYSKKHYELVGDCCARILDFRYACSRARRFAVWHDPTKRIDLASEPDESKQPGTTKEKPDSGRPASSPEAGIASINSEDVEKKLNKITEQPEMTEPEIGIEEITLPSVVTPLSEGIPEKTFTLKLIQAMVKVNPDSNLILSPLSIKTILKVLEAGTKGKAKKKIKDLLGESSPSKLKDLKEAESWSKIATSLFYSHDLQFKQQFLQEMRNLDVSLEPADFSSSSTNLANYMNSWVEEKTGGQIASIIDAESLKSLTELVLLNAAYFKGIWMHAFNPNLTSISDFSQINNQTTPAVFMYNKEQGEYRAGYFKEYQITMLELPYKNGSYVMQILLPDKNTTLPNVENILSAEAFQQMEDDIEEADVELFMPRFQYDLKTDLKRVLSEIGLGGLFYEENFTEIFSNSENSKVVDKIFHSAVINVTEEGTIAAAASAFQISNLKYRQKFKIEVDRPFLFFVYNQKMKEYLFAGRIIF